MIMFLVPVLAFKIQTYYWPYYCCDNITVCYYLVLAADLPEICLELDKQNSASEQEW